MNSKLYKTYLQCLNPNLIILQQNLEDEDLDTDLDAEESDNLKTTEKLLGTDTEGTEEDTEETGDLELTLEVEEADLKFSADLASLFGNTVNKFTRAAAKIIKQRTINKELSDNIYNLMGKIKDLLDAASKSV